MKCKYYDNIGADEGHCMVNPPRKMIGNDCWKNPIVPVDRIHCAQFESEKLKKPAKLIVKKTAN